MKQRSNLAWLVWASCAALGLAVGCSGSDGAVGPAGEQGPSGPPGSDGTADPSVSGVTPGFAFLGRSTEVAISGFGTRWSSAAQVDFGPGVTVDSLTVASETGIVAKITIDELAPVGPRDVTVTEGEAVVYQGAFSLKAPLEVPLVGGTLAQGSIILGRGKQLDLSTPFDTLDGPESTLVAVGDSSPGITQAVSDYGIDFLAFIDVNATAGSQDVVVESGITGDIVRSRARAAFDAAARMPTPVTSGVPVTGTVTSPLATLLYGFMPQPNRRIDISVTSANGDAFPAFALLPASGMFSDLITYSDIATVPSGSTPTPYYIIYWDQSGEVNYDFSLDVTESPLGETEPNDTCAVAEMITLPYSSSDLVLESALDEDWFTFDATAADIGSKIHVQTFPGDAETDTWVDVLAADCMTSLGGPSSDANFHEDFTSTPIPAAGKYYIKVLHSPLPQGGSFYDLAIDLVLPSVPETEPNDTSGTANAAMSGIPAASSIGVPGDVDFFSIAATTGQTITATITAGTMDVCGPAGNIDSEIAILDIDGLTVLDFNDDINIGSNWCSSAQTTAAADGTYFVRARASVQYCPMCVYDYNVTVNVQ